MAVYRINSFWDYLGQGAQAFQESMAEKQRRELLEAQEKRAKTMFGYQAAPYEMAGQIMQDKTPEATFIPNLISGAGGGQVVPLPGPFSENQYALARAAVPGLESPTARLRRRRKEKVEDELQELSVPPARLNAAKATGQIGGVTSDIQRVRADEMRKQVADLAKPYVAKAIADMVADPGGKPFVERNLAAVANTAYANFTADPTTLKSLGVEGISSDILRPLFDEATREYWKIKRDQDIASIRADAYATGQGPADKTPQIMNALTNIAKQFKDRADKTTQSTLEGRVGLPLKPEDAEKIQADVTIFNQLMAASAALGAGTMPVEQAAKLLEDATKMITGEGMPQGPPPPGGQVFDDAAIVAEAQKYAPSQWRPKLQREVDLYNKSAGTQGISQEQMNRVLLLLERRRP